MAVPPYLQALANSVPAYAAQSWTPRVSGGVNAPIDATGGQGASMRNFMADIYGYNTQANIAALQGQYGLEGQRLQNTGALDIANVNNTGANQRNLNDNRGADYRTQIGAQASTYAPQLQQDRFQQVWNGAAAPMMQSLFGITPGDPFVARQAPNFMGGGPGYGGGATPAPQSPQPVTQQRPVTQGQPMGGNPAQKRQQMQQRPQMTQTSSPGRTASSRTQGSNRPAPQQAPQPQQQAPMQQPQRAPRVAQASGTGTLDALKPLPSQYGGPKITSGPVYTNSQMGAMVGRQQGMNAARQASQDRSAERRMAGAGFGSRSPQLEALKNQNAIARSFQDQEVATTLPAQYAQANANQRLSSERAAADVYGQRVGEELSRRGQQANVTSNFMNMIFGLA